MWAEIESSDADSVRVRTVKGEYWRIDRSMIRKVDHPGLAAKVGGGMLLGHGVLGALTNAAIFAIGSQGSGGGGIGIVLPLVGTAESLGALIGGIFLIRHGYQLEARSEAAFEPPFTPLPRLGTATSD